MTHVRYTRVPQEISITLKPPAIVEGRVIDAVSNRPVPNVIVHAQGVTRHNGFQATTDANGHYQLRMSKDHYNIWADMEERIAIAVDTIEAIPGKTVTDADIKMVRGGFVVGTLINGKTNEPIPIPEGQTRYVACHGPARPSTSAEVTITMVNPDGTYRLRVAPGRNYIYLMSGDMNQYVTVEDGEEVKLDLVSGESIIKEPYLGPERSWLSELRERARKEDAEEEAAIENSTTPRR